MRWGKEEEESYYFVFLEDNIFANKQQKKGLYLHIVTPLHPIPKTFSRANIFRVSFFSF